jgi:5-methylcytosine-specific restriction endonuclease McrA
VIKTCKTCHDPKDVSCFYPDKKSRDRLRYECKDCCKAASVARLKADPVKARAIQERFRARHDMRLKWRQYYAAHPEQGRARQRRHYTRHREEALAYARTYGRAHREQINARFRERYATDPTYRARWALYAMERHRKLAATPIDSSALVALWEACRGRCQYCGGPANTLDHVIPLSRGGPHAIGNVVPACKPCNSRKRHRTPQEWRKFVALEEAQSCLK